jgi:hypothetical protein
MARRFVPVLVAVLFAGAVTGVAGNALAQSGGYETPQQNVRSSQQYQQLTCTNAAFRATRIAKECGPLQGSQFYDSCVASFNCNNQPSGANWRQAPPSETTK